MEYKMKLITIILMINLSAFSMENNNMFNTQEIAFEYLEIVKKNLHSNKLKSDRSIIGSRLGLVITPEEFDNYFFDIVSFVANHKSCPKSKA